MSSGATVRNIIEGVIIFAAVCLSLFGILVMVAIFIMDVLAK